MPLLCDRELFCTTLATYSYGVGAWSVPCTPICQLGWSLVTPPSIARSIVAPLSAGILFFGPLAAVISIVLGAILATTDYFGPRVPLKVTIPAFAVLLIGVGFYFGVVDAFANHGPPIF